LAQKQISQADYDDENKEPTHSCFGAVAKPLEDHPLRHNAGALRNRHIKLPQEPNTFAACFAKQFATVCADRPEAMSMIDPGDLRGGGEQDLELKSPGRAFNRKEARLKFAKPIGVKVDVLSFILQDERARFFQNGISRA
jgi:hypothetical protein